MAMLADPSMPMRVAETCRVLGLSNKHLVDQFRQLVGLPPKVMGRVMRFQRVIDACRAKSWVDWHRCSK